MLAGNAERLPTGRTQQGGAVTTRGRQSRPCHAEQWPTLQLACGPGGRHPQGSNLFPCCLPSARRAATLMFPAPPSTSDTLPGGAIRSRVRQTGRVYQVLSSPACGARAGSPWPVQASSACQLALLPRSGITPVTPRLPPAGSTIPVASEGFTAYTLREPIGVAGQIIRECTHACTSVHRTTRPGRAFSTRGEHAGCLPRQLFSNYGCSRHCVAWFPSLAAHAAWNFPILSECRHARLGGRECV